MQSLNTNIVQYDPLSLESILSTEGPLLVKEESHPSHSCHVFLVHTIKIKKDFYNFEVVHND
jgi:hypothetical protein